MHHRLVLLPARSGTLDDVSRETSRIAIQQERVKDLTLLPWVCAFLVVRSHHLWGYGEARISIRRWFHATGSRHFKRRYHKHRYRSGIGRRRCMCELHPMPGQAHGRNGQYAG